MGERNNSWERYFYITSLLVLVSLPFGYFWGNLAFGTWFLSCVVWGVKCNYFKFDRTLFPLLIFSLFSFISVIWSQDQAETVHAISRQLPLALFPLAGMFIPSISKARVEQMFNQFSLFLCFLIIILVIMAVLKGHKYQYKGFLFYHELVSPLKLNAIYVSYIISTFFLFTLNTINKINLRTLLVLIILGTFLVMLSSKMILFITGLLSVITVALKIRGRMQKLIILGLILSASILVLKYAKPIQNRFSTEFNTSVSEIFYAESFKKGRAYTGLEARLLQMRVFKEIVDKPSEYIVGVGLSASNKEIREIQKELNTPVAFQNYNFHNQYIQVMADLGLIGLAFLLLILSIGFKKSLKINFFLPFIIITIALFFSESVIWRQRGIMFFGIMYVLLITSSRANESKKSISEV